MRVVVLAGLLALVVTGRALATPCALPAGTARPYLRVQVNPVFLGVRFDHTRSTDDLEFAMAAKFDRHVYKAGGATEITVRTFYRISPEPIDGMSGCFFPHAIDFYLAFGMTVFTAREIPDGTCSQRVVMEHERKHVELGKALLWQQVEVFRQALRDEIQHIGPMPDASIKAAAAAWGERLTPGLKRMVDAAMKQNSERQAAIDTVAEYDRVSRVCGGETQRLIFHPTAERPAASPQKPNLRASRHGKNCD